MANTFAILIFLVGIICFIFSLIGKIEMSLLFMIPLLPLQNIIVKLHQFPFGKDFIDILLVAMIIGWFLRTLVKKENIFEKTPFNLLLFLLTLITYIGLWRGSSYLGFPAPINASDIRVQNWKNYIILPLLYFITLNNIKDIKWMKRLVLLMVFSMFLMDYYTINQIRWITSWMSRIKLHGTFVWLGPNELAAFYATYTFVILGMFWFDKVKIRRILFGAVILLNLYCVLFLYSRGAYIAVLIGLIFFSLVKNKKLLIPLVAILIFWQTFLPSSVVERINITENQEGVLDTSSQSRLVLWQESIKLFEQNPIIGVGYDVFSYLGYEKRDTHNIYLKVLAEQGIIGIIILFLLFYLALKYGWKLYKMASDSFLRGLGLGFTLCVIATMAVNMFGDRWTYLPLGAYFWVFLALVVRGNIITKESKLNESITSN